MVVDSVPAEGPSTTGRAGRNLPAAIAVGVVLAVAIIASLFVYKVLFVVLVLAAILLAVDEVARALSTGGTRVERLPIIAGTAAILGSAYFGGPMAMLVASALTILSTIVWRMPKGSAGFVRDTTAGVFVVGYVPVLAGFAIMLTRPDDGPWRVMTFVLVVVASDIGGYAVGVLFGKHPMAPAISPKKSWEGFTGSAATSFVAGTLTVHYFLDGSLWAGALVGAAAVATATLGDLIESMIKRDLGIKDMSNLLPGHGGMMDRLDSLLAAAPVIWLMLYLLVR